MKRLAKVSLVLGMTIHVFQILLSVRKLTLLTVLALAILAELSTQLRLVPA
jgi:hypothetical protein